VPREPARQREPIREREAQFEREPVREREAIREREPGREREPVREREREPLRMREPQPAPTVSDPEFNANADQNLAEMAQRLEAALRRPPRTNEVRPEEPTPRAMTADTDSAPPANPRAAAPPRTNEVRPEEPTPRAMTADTDSAPPANPRAAAPPPAESSAARAEPKPPKSLYDSLEKEMANLLGRPSGKS
jgi:hypothetical protein